MESSSGFEVLEEAWPVNLEEHSILTECSQLWDILKLENVRYGKVNIVKADRLIVWMDI